MARAVGWEPPREDEPLIVPAEAGKMLPILQEPALSSGERARMLHPLAI
jgi:hypothetical protein